MSKDNLLKVFLNTVEEQLTSGKPPFVQNTLWRLVKMGYTQKEAKSMMAGVMAHQMADSILGDTPFNQLQYQLLLEKLPKLPQ
ncbi:MAG: hypothetical protein ACRBG0_22500 [Lewinella sp.]|jgi:hypothetical protein|uniref:hypothetical protein n=1 Tax=Lewinella sp. TaxID=2004506 RepID=UPI003D6B2F19